MPRIALGLEYDGTDFVGWQIQRAGRSIEAALAAAVEAVANEPLTVRGAGRTDAGVHAAQQVAHFDTSAERSERQWLLGINSNLPPDVAVRWVREVPATFDARRSAVRRRYRYSVLAAADAACTRTRARLVDPRAARRRRDDSGVATLARRARLLSISRSRLPGEIPDAPARGRPDCARGASGRRSLADRFHGQCFSTTHGAQPRRRARRDRSRDLTPAAAGEMLASRDRTQAAVAAPPRGSLWSRCCIRSTTGCHPLSDAD